MGNWQEIPEGGRQTGPKPKMVMAMGQHYAGQQVLRSAAVKCTLVKRILGLFSVKQPSFALTAEGLLVRDVWSWDELAALHEETVWPLVEQRAPALPEELEAPVEEGKPTGEADVDFGGQSDDDPSSSSVSPSASVADGVEGEDGGFLPLEESPDTVKWFKQGKKLHVVSGIDEAARPTLAGAVTSLSYRSQPKRGMALLLSASTSPVLNVWPECRGECTKRFLISTDDK